jgi:hypothetical protein
MASTINLTIDQGSQFSYLFELAGSSQIDLTNAVPYAAMKQEYGSPANTSIPFSTSMTGANVTISMPWSQTANLAPGTWVYDMIVVSGSSNTVIRAVQGRVHVTPRVTTYP